MISKLASATALAVLALGVGTASGYRLGTGAWPDTTELRQKLAALAGQAVAKSAPVNGPKLLYYRNPMGSPDTSRVPKKDSMGMDYLPVFEGDAAATVVLVSKPAVDQKPLYYRNPMGSPDTSPVPKKDSMGMDYLPVFAGDAAAPPVSKPAGDQKPLYYRNPMGLPDTSPVPKKDSMGMDYLPVFADDAAADDGKTVKISLDRVQRSGVRSAPAELRRLTAPVHAHGKVMMDESTLRIVSLRADAVIEKLYANTTGQKVKAGAPLFRIFSKEILNAQALYRVTAASTGQRTGPEVDGALQRLRNLDVPQSHLDLVAGRGKMPMSIEWPSPVSGTVVEKMIIEGERAEPGRALLKIADLSKMWVVAEVAEQDLGMVRVGAKAMLTFRALPGKSIEGKVAFVYPELMAETRTGRVRIVLDNSGGLFKQDMYAEVVIDAGGGDAKVVTVPVDAVIDSGSQQVVIIDKGEGKFEPRQVTVGTRGDGFVEVKSGVTAGENVVISANFLIDAESNLRAALKVFTAEPKQALPPEASLSGVAEAAGRVQ